jgi:hypothetical protein
MAFIGRLQPLLIHFPIALVISAAYWFGAPISCAHKEHVWHEWTKEILIDGTF